MREISHEEENTCFNAFIARTVFGPFLVYIIRQDCYVKKWGGIHNTDFLLFSNHMSTNLFFVNNIMP